MDEKTLQQEVIESMASKVKMQWKVIKLLVTALVIVSCVGMLSVVAMYASTLNFMSQYEYESTTTTTVDVKADGDSSAIYQNGKGNIVNGSEHKSNKKNDNDNEKKETKAD